MSISSVLIVLSCVLVVGLSIYGGYLWSLVFAQRKQSAELQQRVLQRRGEWLESILIIAKVLLEEQGNITECAIRIKVLMDRLYDNQCPKAEFRAIYELAWATAHMPILEQRKKYSRKEIKAFDDEREAIEKQMEQEVKLAAQAILEYDFSKEVELKTNS